MDAAFPCDPARGWARLRYLMELWRQPVHQAIGHWSHGQQKPFRREPLLLSDFPSSPAVLPQSPGSTLIVASSASHFPWWSVHPPRVP